MPVQVWMPQLGESVTEGTITKWLKTVGERVEEFEPLVEVNTDKVDTEIPSPATGTLLEILVPEGTVVKTGAVLAKISGGEEKLERGLPLKAPGTCPGRDVTHQASSSTRTSPGATELSSFLRGRENCQRTPGRPARSPAATGGRITTRHPLLHRVTRLSQGRPELPHLRPHPWSTVYAESRQNQGSFAAYPCAPADRRTHGHQQTHLAACHHDHGGRSRQGNRPPAGQ
jgi:pyruvate/2-oxoglutarate dehydrogenase complex dihydrolipoamide acyltransferase (E2) component